MHLIDTTRLGAESFLGQRVDAARRWLLDADLEPRLAGYRHRPGHHPFIGEHIGKWLDAASLLYRATGDEQLGAKLRMAATELIATQDPDGYLGTYLPTLRYSTAPGAGWDVWSSKYCLLGLLSYHRVSGDHAALVACRRLGDLLVGHFASAGHDILRTDMHRGLASGSVLLAVVRLAAATGEGRYLDFARRILESLDAGPGLRPALLARKGVVRVGNAKAYEMLSCIHGMLEYGILADDADAVAATIAAWEDVRDHHRYITGTASYGEHFHDSPALPGGPDAHLGETCVTTTWIQLSLGLFELTGETRYLDEVERSMFNHLAAAQFPDGSAWCYYVPLQGMRHRTDLLACCASSGPRGFALAPSAAFAVTPGGGLAIGLYQDAVAEIELGGVAVRIALATGHPYDEHVEVALDPESPTEFEVRFRVPAWADGIDIDEPSAVPLDGWIVLPTKTWHPGDRLGLRIPVPIRRVAGTGWNAGRSSLAQGPLVLSYREESRWPSFDAADPDAGLPDAVGEGRASRWSVVNPLETRGGVKVDVLSFAEAGQGGLPIRTWLDDRARGDVSVFLGGRESISGTAAPYGDPLDLGSAVDGDPDTAIESFATSGGAGDFDWVAVELDEPATFSRIVVTQGVPASNGGWFNTEIAAPELQIRRSSLHEWETVHVFEDYPEASTFHPVGAEAGLRFEVVLPQPVTATGARVRGLGSVGRMSSGRRISIAELAAFVD